MVNIASKNSDGRGKVYIIILFKKLAGELVEILAG